MFSREKFTFDIFPKAPTNTPKRPSAGVMTPAQIPLYSRATPRDFLAVREILLLHPTRQLTIDVAATRTNIFTHSSNSYSTSEAPGHQVASTRSMLGLAMRGHFGTQADRWSRHLGRHSDFNCIYVRVSGN